MLIILHLLTLVISIFAWLIEVANFDELTSEYLGVKKEVKWFHIGALVFMSLWIIYLVIVIYPVYTGWWHLVLN